MPLTGYEIANLRRAGAELQNLDDAEARIVGLRMELAGVVAQRNALRAVLREVAPSHRVLTRETQNALYDEGATATGRECGVRQADIEAWLRSTT